jgi:hypothetical protein
MVNIHILQTDNRPTLDYLLLSQKVNKKMCSKFSYKYSYIPIDNDKYSFHFKQFAKLYIVNDFIQNLNDDILIFLDSDAWIQNGFYLQTILNNLINDTNKHGCYSRDTYGHNWTYINSGSFIMKINDFTKNMYKELITSFEKELKDNNNDDKILFEKNTKCDQYYMSNFVFTNKDSFYIFQPSVLNTADGIILRHNWWKSNKMYEDMNEILKKDIITDNTIFDPNKYYDKKPFPNAKISMPLYLYNKY